MNLFVRFEIYATYCKNKPHSENYLSTVDRAYLKLCQVHNTHTTHTVHTQYTHTHTGTVHTVHTHTHTFTTHTLN